MDRKESEMIEFKKTTAQLKEAVISLCAMLNKHGKGTVYFGIKDDGTVCGQPIGVRTTADISHEIRSNLKPLPEVSINVLEEEGLKIVEVVAEGTDTPYSAFGRYYTRIDDSDLYMDSRQLWKFFESKDRSNSKWEEERTRYGIEKVDEDLLIQYVREANESGRLNYIFRNSQEALSKLNLMDDEGYLNNAGYYLFGNDGPITLKEVVYSSDERESFQDLKQFKGNIFECIREGIRYIQTNTHVSAKIVGAKRVETPEIPAKAIREIVVNSFAHCRYQKDDCNEISITRSKIRIYNPGGILDDISPVDFANGKIGSKIRNPLIAIVLFKNGLIDAFGTGFDRTFRACADSGLEYEYRNDEYGFTFIFKRRKSSFGEGVVDVLPGRRINPLENEILRLLSDNVYITSSEIALAVGKSEPTVARYLKNLASNNRIQRVGSRKSGYWKVLD